MRRFTFKGTFLAIVLMLFGCLSLYAADDDLITKQITIKLEQAGTLPNKIGSSKKYKITNLKIVGEINGTDWSLIRNMAGRDRDGYKTSGKLSVLDLSETKIVSGGDYYYNNNYANRIYTSDDKIGDRAFDDCSGLTSLTLPSSVTEIGDFAFSGCSGLTSLNIPSGVTEIGRSAFYGCSGLTSLIIPSGVTKIGDGAFEGCSGLTSLSLPSSVTYIGDGAFRSCSGLTSVHYQINDDFETYLSKGHPSIDVNCGIEYYLNDQKITSVVIPSTITKLGKYVFQNCKDLTSVYVSWQSPISAGSAFSGVGKSKCTLYVPQGTEQDYWLIDVWGDFGSIVEYDPTGIDNVTTSTDAKEVSRYSVNGQRLSAPTKGLNLVKYSDGSVKKVAVQ